MAGFLDLFLRISIADKFFFSSSMVLFSTTYSLTLDPVAWLAGYSANRLGLLSLAGWFPSKKPGLKPAMPSLDCLSLEPLDLS